MAQPDDPIDIVDRREFPDEPLPKPSPTPRQGATAPDGTKRRPLWMFALVGVAIGLVISWVVLNQGRSQQPEMPADHPPVEASSATPTPLSPAELADLKAKVDAEPDNPDHRLVYGVALYNGEQYEQAEEQFLAATELDPADTAPWYNLGFLYLSLDPPAVDEARAAWNKVVELVPGTSMAETVSQHLQRLDAPPPTAMPTPTSTP